MNVDRFRPCRFTRLLVVTLLAAVGVMPVGFAADPPAPGQATVRNLSERLDAMDALLAQIHATPDAEARTSLLHQHWQQMQDYMGVSLRLVSIGASPTAAPACRVSQADWRGLDFPAERSGRSYLGDMQDLSRVMHKDLARMKLAADAESLRAMAVAHVNGNYRYLETMRGLGWMFESRMPTSQDKQTVHARRSAGAEAAERYCTQCHVEPPVGLHTKAEWGAVIASMDRHIELSDAGPGMCVTLPTEDELKAIAAHYRVGAP